jgi:hypothetical protein
MVSERFDGLGIAQWLNLDRLGMVRWLDLDGLSLDALVTARLSKDLMGSGLPDSDRMKGLWAQDGLVRFGAARQVRSR